MLFDSNAIHQVSWVVVMEFTREKEGDVSRTDDEIWMSTRDTESVDFFAACDELRSLYQSQKQSIKERTTLISFGISQYLRIDAGIARAHVEKNSLIREKRIERCERDWRCCRCISKRTDRVDYYLSVGHLDSDARSWFLKNGHCLISW